MGAASSTPVNYGFNDETFIKEGLDKYSGIWNAKLGEKTQTQHFREVVPTDERELTQVVKDNHLDQFFTCDRFRTGEGFNAGHLFRQTTKMPDVVVFSTDDYVIMHPMSEPGRDAGNTNYRATHFMLIKRNETGVITFSEFLPSTVEELDDLAVRNEMVERAYEYLAENTPLNQCGDLVIEKARSLGVSEETGIRDFFIIQILNLDEEFRSGLPGYKLLNADGVDIAGDEEKVRSVVEEVFACEGKVVSCVQDPTRNTQLISHIHTFKFPEAMGIPEKIQSDYICTKTLHKCKSELMGDVEGGEDDCGLTRQSTVVCR